MQALIASWDFDDFVFLEHFAVDPARRSGGIGGQMLDAMLAHCGKRACLEAELPETELAARRIGFYERHGFTVCELRAMETLVHTRVYGQAPAAEQ